MAQVREIDGMSGSELLDHVDDLSATQRRCEAEILRAAVQHAVLDNPDTLDPQLTKLPGRERAKRFGGVGTPRVGQFCCAELGARLGVSAWSAHALIADALDLTTVDQATEPYRPGAAKGAGQSRIGNYGPMTGLHHRIKTHGGWDVKQPFLGIYLWQDPHGAHYLVDHTGTRRIRTAA